MIEQIKNVLASFKEVSGYEIVEINETDSELFFIKRVLDMNRSKRINNFNVIVYRDVKKGETLLRGSAQTSLFPTMSLSEIKEALEQALYSAQFALNQMYQLAQPTGEQKMLVGANWNYEDAKKVATKVAEAAFGADHFENGYINSCEIVVRHRKFHFVNSNQVDLSRESDDIAMEVIATWKGLEEEIELYRQFDYAVFDPNLVKNEVEEMLLTAKGRAEATLTPDLKDSTVLLRHDSIQQVMEFFTANTNASTIYQRISSAIKGYELQGSEITGDPINIELDPYLTNSTRSSPFDDHGFIGKPTQIMEKGMVINNWGSSQFCEYLCLPYTVNTSNVILSKGSKSEQEMKQLPYLEVVSLSDLQVDIITGTVGGEIRFAYYFDGKQIYPVSGGSFTCNLNEIKGKVYFSNILKQNNSFIGPTYMALPHTNVLHG